MPMHLEAQRTIDLESDAHDDTQDSPIAPVKRPSKKGIPTGAKWHFTDEQLAQLLPELRHARDKCMVLVGTKLATTSWLFVSFGEHQVMAQLIATRVLMSPLIHKDFREC